MFKRDQRAIAALAKQSPEGFFAVVTFAMLSANVHFNLMRQAAEDVAKTGELSRWLRASKRDGYRYLLEHHHALYIDYVTNWIHHPVRSHAVAFQRLLAVPGLGLTKAGFAVQLLLGEIGSLDRHNRELYGLPIELTRVRKYNRRGVARKVRAYLDACHLVGTSEFLWDTWCNHLAKVYPNDFQSGEHVSAYHLEVVQCLVKNGSPD